MWNFYSLVKRSEISLKLGNQDHIQFTGIFSGNKKWGKYSSLDKSWDYNEHLQWIHIYVETVPSGKKRGFCKVRPI